MPVVLVSTLSDEGQTNLGSYSLCFPHLIAGKYAMMLICREDSIYFWFAEPKKPYKIRIPEDRGASLNTITYAAKRFDPSVTWDDEACAMIMNVPRVFLNRVFKGVVEQANAEGITHITPEFMAKVRDKRNAEKGN